MTDRDRPGFVSDDTEYGTPYIPTPSRCTGCDRDSCRDCLDMDGICSICGLYDCGNLHESHGSVAPLAHRPPFKTPDDFYIGFADALHAAHKLVIANAGHGYNAKRPVYTMFLNGPESILSIIYMKTQRLAGMIDAGRETETLQEESIDIINYAAFLYAWVTAQSAQ